jgi:hypothetical protein
MADPVLTEQQWSRDLDGSYKRTDISSSFSDFEPKGTCIQYKKSIKDATYTISEEFIEAGGEGTWQVDCTTSQEPIETHKYFWDIDSKEQRNWALWKKDPKHPQLDPAGWEPLASQDEKIWTLYYWWSRDVTSYLAPRIVLRWTVIEQHPPNCSHVGLIAEGWGFPAINTPGGMNFLMSGANGRQLGTPESGSEWYQNTYEFLSSARQTGATGEPGWLQFLYTNQ